VEEYLSGDGGGGDGRKRRKRRGEAIHTHRKGKPAKDEHTRRKKLVMMVMLPGARRGGLSHPYALQRTGSLKQRDAFLCFNAVVPRTFSSSVLCGVDTQRK